MVRSKFTYLEILVSIFLLGFLFTPLITIYGSAMNFSNMTLAKSQALNIAKTNMEKLANVAYDEAKIRSLEAVKQEVISRGGSDYILTRLIDKKSNPLRVEIRVGFADEEPLMTVVTLIEDNK